MSPTPSLCARPICAAAYAPFGALLAADHPDRPTPRVANHGEALAFDDLAPLISVRPGAKPTASVFRCKPLAAAPLAVRWLERHPASTQLFVPMGAARYLLVVALGGDAPDLSTLAAFVVSGARAITYHPGVWHHPMVALDAPTDFINLIWLDGSPLDCHEVAFDPPAALIHLSADASPPQNV
jgi:ureidoglycolate lyase